MLIGHFVFLVFMEDEDGIPVPDLDCFPMSSPHLSPELPSRIDYARVGAACGVNLNVRAPLRCTDNSCVLSGYSDYDGSCSVVKITRYKKRCAREWQCRRSIPNCPYLVELNSFHETYSHAVIKMEYCSGGDIKDRSFTEQEIWMIIHDIGTALSILHESGWMHLDVSPTNILMSRNVFKLADFGTMLEIGEFCIGCEGAGPYVSPEALDSIEVGGCVNGATDIFSLGVVLLECASGKPAPRGGMHRYTELRNDMIGLGSPDFPCNCSEELICLVNRMLTRDPESRPTAIELTNMPFAQLSIGWRADEMEYQAF
jgi:membrane-associated tyrosine/threonine-specific cdc2-inhibitory kinase